ncbi:hypothetical protein GZH46_01313, partial [Fragariocoptes setiger]
MMGSSGIVMSTEIPGATEKIKCSVIPKTTNNSRCDLFSHPQHIQDTEWRQNSTVSGSNHLMSSMISSNTSVDNFFRCHVIGCHNRKTKATRRTTIPKTLYHSTTAPKSRHRSNNSFKYRSRLSSRRRTSHNKSMSNRSNEHQSKNNMRPTILFAIIYSMVVLLHILTITPAMNQAQNIDSTLDGQQQQTDQHQQEQVHAEQTPVACSDCSSGIEIVSSNVQSSNLNDRPPIVDQPIEGRQLSRPINKANFDSITHGRGRTEHAQHRDVGDNYHNNHRQQHTTRPALHGGQNKPTKSSTVDQSSYVAPIIPHNYNYNPFTYHSQPAPQQQHYHRHQGHHHIKTTQRPARKVFKMLPPQNCSSTGSTVCDTVSSYPSDEIFRVVSDTKKQLSGTSFNLNSFFSDESRNADEPFEAPPEANANRRPHQLKRRLTSGILVYSTEVKYPHEPAHSSHSRHHIYDTSTDEHIKPISQVKLTDADENAYVDEVATSPDDTFDQQQQQGVRRSNKKKSSPVQTAHDKSQQIQFEEREPSLQFDFMDDLSRLSRQTYQTIPHSRPTTTSLQRSVRQADTSPTENNDNNSNSNDSATPSTDTEIGDEIKPLCKVKSIYITPRAAQAKICKKEAFSHQRRPWTTGSGYILYTELLRMSSDSKF